MALARQVLDARDKENIHHLDRFIGMNYRSVASAREHVHEILVRNISMPAVGHVNAKRLKRYRFQMPAYLFRGHNVSVSREKSSGNFAPPPFFVDFCFLLSAFLSGARSRVQLAAAFSGVPVVEHAVMRRAGHAGGARDTQVRTPARI